MLAVLLCLPAAVVFAADWHVATNGNDAADGTTWATAKQTIQAGVDAAFASDTVWVSNGVYATGGMANYPAGSILTNRVVINKAILVESVNGPEVTIIRGAWDPSSDNGRGNAAVRCAYVVNGSTLSGFTLTNGATRTIDSTLTETKGGGVCGQNAGTVRACIIIGNTANAGGGAYGATLNHCLLTQNVAGSGGGSSFATLNQCLLTGNTASDGGGGTSGGTLNNCTVVGNAGLRFGGGAGYCRLYNCIVYSNSAPISPNWHLVYGINNSCTEPEPGGTDNITDDPQFVDAAAGDYRLQDGSPCINAGNNAYVQGATDLDGNPRIANGTVDMGAYERFVPVLEMDPASTNLPAGATSGSAIAVTANIPWLAATNVPWLSITSGASGTTNGTVVFNAASNTLGISRTGTIVVAGSPALQGATAPDPQCLLWRDDAELEAIRPWSRIWGSSSSEWSGPVAVDSMGMVYTAVDAGGSWDGQSHAGLFDFALCKWDAQGQRAWTRMWGTSDMEMSKALAVDETHDRIYVAGETLGALGGETNAGHYDACLTRLDTDGTQQWIRLWGTTGEERTFGAGVDSAGNVYVCGYTLHSMGGQTHNGQIDCFLTKFSAEGTSLWTRLWGSAQSEEPRGGLCVDTQGFVYVVGRTDGAFGGQTNSGGRDAFITKYSPSGDPVWTRLMGSDSTDEAKGIAIAGDGSIYVGGQTWGAFDGQTNHGGADIFLAKLTPDGTPLWTRIRGGGASDWGGQVSVDGQGNAYVLGATTNGFDGQGIVGGYDSFVCKFSSSGDHIWTHIWGGADDEDNSSLAADTCGHVYVSGFTWGQFDGQTNTGEYDVFLTRLDSEGSWLSRTCTVVQAAGLPELEINPSHHDHMTTAATTGHAFSVDANVPWTATTTDTWITVTGGSPGMGPGTVTYDVASNSGLVRSGTIAVSGEGLTRDFTVNQTGVAPAMHEKINCGVYAVEDWELDRDYSTVDGGPNLVTNPIAGASDVPELVYRTRRYGSQVTYDLDMPAGLYNIRLHFADLWAPIVIGQRRFNVSIEGTEVLPEFDIALESGGAFTAVTRTFEGVAVSGGLQIVADAVSGTAQFNGIEVWSDAEYEISGCSFTPAQDQMSLELGGRTGEAYRLWWTTNLMEWPLDQVIDLTTNGIWTDTDISGHPKKYYRMSE